MSEFAHGVPCGAVWNVRNGRIEVHGSEIVGLVLSVGLLVYLAIALLKPEWFA